MITFPQGYGTFTTTIEHVRAVHLDRPEGQRPHPEFWRRLEAWLTWNNSQPDTVLLGIGGGWRANGSTTSEASAANRSFHQTQRFASGFEGYAAVDLVAATGGRHRAPSWAEVESAKLFNLHAFITKPQEPWHVQCVEMRGWFSWTLTGRRDPLPFRPFAVPSPDLGGSVVSDALANIDTVSNGTVGPHPDVQRAQVLLNLFLSNSRQHDWQIQVDGRFGDSTERATRLFQQATNLPVDGVVGEATWRRLLGAHA